MFAWLLNDGATSYEWGEVPDPHPGPNDVRISVQASALNHMDLWLTRGMPKPPAYPHVPGVDVVGVIDEVGSEVSQWSVGDEVVANSSLVPATALDRGYDAILDPNMKLLGEHGWGGHGEYCVVPAHQVTRRPENRTWEELATYPICGPTAWRMLRRARVQAGDRVLITGIGGGVATQALMFALHLGAHVTVTSRDQDKLDQAAALGAHEQQLSNEKLEGNFDVVVDSIGPAVWDNLVASLNRGGRLATCGGTTGTRVELSLPRVFFKQLEVIGSTGGSPKEFEEVTELYRNGLPTVIDRVFPLAEYPDAVARLESGAQFGKIVLIHD